MRISVLIDQPDQPSQKVPAFGREIQLVEQAPAAAAQGDGDRRPLGLFLRPFPRGPDIADLR
jgi:hypothetical protein